MATLVEGRKYGLASNEYSQDSKTIIHLKLTDTAWKTLEDLSKAKNAQASIQFHGTDGTIKIPSHGNHPERIFQISLSALAGDQNACFDCIQQTSRNGESGLVSLGTMHNRITVMATDDVFDRTKAKMSQVEEESKKVCTKQIGLSSRNISKQVKKPMSPGTAKMLTMKKKESESPTYRPGLTSSKPNVYKQKPAPSSLSSSNSSSQALTRPSPNITPSLPASKLSTTGATPSRVLTSAPSKYGSIINMPYRDRIIHLLALRPYKKPELVLRLQKDGVLEKDKNSLGNILQQVASMNRDNSFSLAKSGWLDVRQDWPFYSEEDKLLLQKNLHQESRVNPTSPAVSPASSNPESPNNSQKRPSDELDEIPNPNKKKRISHMDRRKVEEPPPILVQSTPHQRPSPTANRENLEGNADEGSDEPQDFMKKFVQIDDNDQRKVYKQEFNREYSEYRQLHEQVDQVARRFQQLRTQINQTEEGSPDFEMLKREVLSQYEAQKSDPKFMDKKQRMEYLHQKLGHIKRLIHEYDQRVQAKISS